MGGFADRADRAGTYEKRFNALERARERGETTLEFDEFLVDEIENYKHFHTYWERRRESDAERGIATLYTRYESLCENTEPILREMLAFSGFKVMEESFECTLQEFKCHVGSNEKGNGGAAAAATGRFPSHRALYTREQADKILEAHADVLTLYGYQIDRATLTLTLKPPTIPMCNAHADHL